MVSSNLPSIQGWNGYHRRESADIPRSRERGERSAQAIPSARNENGRGRPLSLLLLPLPALLRHVMSGRRTDYFRPHTPPHRVVFLTGGGIASISARLRALLAVGHRRRAPHTKVAVGWYPPRVDSTLAMGPLQGSTLAGLRPPTGLIRGVCNRVRMPEWTGWRRLWRDGVPITTRSSFPNKPGCYVLGIAKGSERPRPVYIGHTGGRTMGIGPRLDHHVRVVMSDRFWRKLKACELGKYDLYARYTLCKTKAAALRVEQAMLSRWWLYPWNTSNMPWSQEARWR
jgi:hypothetical protein